jgi:asparagine N-glycosylation enzyme membrane subunit Stt3
MKNNILEYILTIIGLLVLAVILFGYPTLLLWNWLMPTIFNLPYITFWQACGINLLASILFKSTINIKKD